MGAMDDMLASVQSTGQQQKTGSALDAMLASVQPQSLSPDQMVAYGAEEAPQQPSKILQAITSPASAALEALLYLDKPRAFVAGALQNLVGNAPQGENIYNSAMRGARDNISYKEAMPQDEVKKSPTAAAIAAFGADVVLDPLNFIPPAKLVKLGLQGSKAIGLTDKVAPIAGKIADTEKYQAIKAFVQDNIIGTNRLEDEVADFKRGRATDQVAGQDIVDAIKPIKKEFGEDADVLTKYIEAIPEGSSNQLVNPADIAKMAEEETLASKIASGEIQKQSAFDALRNTGKDVPDYLLQTGQRQAKEAGEAIPEYITREQVLQQIPQEGLRKAIQSVGDKAAKMIQGYSDKLNSTGRLGDAPYVNFSDGSHLRRSLEKWEKPEDFLKAVKENGTQEEWRRAYKDLNNSTAPGKQGFGRAHSVDTKDFIQRQTLSEETLTKLGLVTDPEYRFMDSVNRASKTLREDEFLSKVANTWGKGADEAADLSKTLPKARQYQEIPNTESFGTLAGKWVPKDIADQVIRATGQGAKPGELAATYQKMVSWWKVGKLAQPSSVMRNFYSGMPMANPFGQVPFQSLPKQMAKVTQAYKSEGKNHPLIRELRESGILNNGWNKEELKNIIGENPTGIKKLADWSMEAFGAPDKFWKAVVYSYHKDAGKTAEEAAKIANKALLDYSAAPEWINTLAKTGIVPFARFPYAAGKETLKAAYERPAQITKFIKPMNQDDSKDREKIMPDYMRSKTLLPLGQGERMVNGNPQKVNNNLDMSYILPFANDISAGNPAIDALQLYRTGKNGIGQEIIKPGMTENEKVKEYLKYALNSAAPSMLSTYNAEKLYNGVMGNTDRMGRQYTPGTAAAQVFLGLKNVPINLDELYQQKEAKIKSNIQDNKIMMSQIAKDKSLNNDERKAKLQEHAQRIKQLAAEAKQVSEAYKREKKKER